MNLFLWLFFFSFVWVDIETHIAFEFGGMRVFLHFLYHLFVALMSFLGNLIKQAFLRRRRITPLSRHILLLPTPKVLNSLLLLILSDYDGLIHRIVEIIFHHLLSGEDRSTKLLSLFLVIIVLPRQIPIIILFNQVWLKLKSLNLRHHGI